MKIGIIGAMEVEIEQLKHAIGTGSATECAGMEFFEGTLGQTPVVVVRSGVGKVNAACCVQLLADRFEVTHVINTGVGGALAEGLTVGDIVVSTDAVHHDVDVENLGYAAGQVPGMQPAFEADEKLRDAALAAAHAVASEVAALAGRVASGDQFVYRPQTKQRIREVFGAACCEMEGAAIAQACSLNGLPFVVVRAISDNADGSEPEAYPVFEQKAARHCAAIVEHMVGAGLRSDQR